MCGDSAICIRPEFPVGFHSNASFAHPLISTIVRNFIIVSVIDKTSYGLGIGPEPTSLRGLGGLISEYPSPRRFCLKRLISEHRLPRFGIIVFLLLRYSRSAVPYSVIFGTVSRSRPARDFLHPPPGGRAPITPLYPSARDSLSLRDQNYVEMCNRLHGSATHCNLMKALFGAM